MKLSRIIAVAALAAMTALVSCEQTEEDLGPASLKLDTAEIAFEAAENSQPVTFTATRDWTATVSKDAQSWLTVSPASGSASAKEQTVTIEVMENTGYDRSGTVTIDIGLDSKDITVTQKGPGGSNTYDGTLASPYNPETASDVAAALEIGAKTDGDVYVAGKISSVKYTFNASYGTATFNISEDGTESGTQFQCYNVYYLGNRKWKDGDTQIAVGDEVIICGKLTNYNGTPETASKEAYIYSLNGQTDGGNGSGSDDPGTPSGDGTLASPYNPKAASDVASALESGAKTGSDVYVAGKISSIKYTFSAQYGTATFYISEDGTANGTQFQCYSVYYLGNRAWADGDTQIAVGDEVIICGKLTNYNGTPETASKEAYIYSLNGQTDGGNGSGNDDPGTPSGDGTLASPYNPKAASDVASALESGAKTGSDVYVAGKISSIKYTFSAQYGTATFYISEDGTANGTQFQCYSVYYLGNRAWADGDTQIAVGDEVIICGKLTNYNGTPETASKEAYIYSLNGQTDGGNGSGNDDPGTPSGDGTLASPYNPKAASDVASALESGAKTGSDVYVAGKISSIKYTFSAQYGTATFYISEDGTANGTQFQCYSVYYLGNRAWADGDTQVAVGDEVIICGKLINFNGTPETASREAYIYSLNGQTDIAQSDVFGVGSTELNVGASATSATIKVTGNVAWTASCDNEAFTLDKTSGEGAGEITVTFAANEDTENARVANITVSTTADVATKSYTVVLTQAKASAAGGEDIVLTFPDDNSENNKVSSYTDTWTAKSGNYSWSITAFNNNKWGNDWTYIRCGRKNNASVASIVTDSAIDFPISSVVVTYDKFGNVNSHKLLVASDADFTENVQEIAGTATSAGDATYTVPSPAAGMYYKLVIDNASASSNGSVQVSKVKYVAE